MLSIGSKRNLINRKSFKEIMENVNYIHDNIDKYFNDIFKKSKKKEQKKKVEKFEDDDIE